MGSITITLSLLFFSIGLLRCLADPKDFSIVGYSEDDLTSQERPISLFESWRSSTWSYASFEEKLQRFEIFIDNVRHIDETNTEKTIYWLGLDEFADMRHDEFKEKYFGVNPTRVLASEPQGKSFMYEDVVNLPKSSDWRKKVAVTATKNQGACGSCWTFSTAAGIVGINQIETGSLVKNRKYKN